jgi:hypothetical protein
MIDEADAEGVRALALARQTGSERTFGSLRLLADRRANGARTAAKSGFLQAWRDEPEVRTAS